MWSLDGHGRLRYDTVETSVPRSSPGFSALRGNMTIDTKGGHPAMDYPEHTRTYTGFVRGALFLTVFVALLLLGMLVMLV
jgi:hypothetical protein